MFNISNEETVRRLRAKGQPIRLFAETDKDRRLRLRALELIEEKGHERQGGQNDFRKALEDVESIEREMQKRNNKGKKKDDTSQVDMGILDLGLVKSDPDKLYPIIYYALKRTLKEWGEAMDERSGWESSVLVIPIADSFISGYRARQAYYSRQTGCSYASSICGIPQTTVQNPPIESMSPIP